MQSNINEAINMIREGKAGAAISCLEKMSQPRQTRAIVDSPAKVADYCADMKLLEHEELHALLLDAKNRVIKRVLIGKGTVDRCAVFPREIFREVLLINAAGFIVVHNHPSGDSTPSAEDDRLTKTIKEGATLLQIMFVDHIIVGDSYYSYTDERKM